MSIAEIMERAQANFMAERAQGIDAIIHLKFTGREAGEWNAVIRDGKCLVAQGLPKSRPTITLSCDSDDFVKMATGELDSERAVMDGTIRVAGDAALAHQLVGLFSVP